MIEYYAGTLEEVEALDATINTNCGWPNSAQASKWAVPRLTTMGTYCIPVPQGTHGFTKQSQNASIIHDIITGVEFPELEGL